MLRLNRKKGESIVIELGDGQMVEVTVMAQSNGQVQLGVQAPRGLEVWRKELYPIVMQNRAAAKATSAQRSAIAKRLAENSSK